MGNDLAAEAVAEIKARKRLAALLGTAEERKQLRQRLGYSARDVSAIVGLSERAILWRESDRWNYSRGSLTSEAGVRYLKFLRTARDDVTARDQKGRSRAGPAKQAA